MNATTGFIIAIDGQDGAGKTTQLQRLKIVLEAAGHTVHATRASGGTPIGEELRKASFSNTERSAEVDLYISLAMHTALGNDITARKQRGEIILVDRSPMSIVAFQNYGAQLDDQKMGFDAYEKMLRLWEIDLLLVFNISQAELGKRNKIRLQTHHEETTNYFEQRDEAYKARVREGYDAANDYATRLSGLHTTIVPIDASGSEDDVHNLIRASLRDHSSITIS